MLIVAALGGNALLRRGEPLTAANQRDNVRRAAPILAGLVADGHSLVVTHGNGPQVGLLALQTIAGPAEGIQPLDMLGAQSEGMIGYLLEREMSGLMPPGKAIATLLTQTRIDPGDTAFALPEKPIGPVYGEAEANRLASARGWQVARDGAGWRRVVPSPRPIEILERSVIALLVEHEVTVICGGGGGIPVAEMPDGSLVGIEAVIDKDLASALLAQQLKADLLLLLTDVNAIYRDFGSVGARAIGAVATSDIDPGEFAAGSMGPKVAAAVEFVRATGKVAGIGSLEDAAAILRGERGTRIHP